MKLLPQNPHLNTHVPHIASPSVVASFFSFNTFFLLFFLTLPFQFALSPAPGIDLHSARLFALGLGFAWMTRSLLRRSIFIPQRIEMLLFVSFLTLSTFSLFFAEHLSWGVRKLFFLLSFAPILFVAADILREIPTKKRFAEILVLGSALAASIGIAQFLLSLSLGLDPTLLLWKNHLLPIFAGNTVSEVLSEYSSMVANVGGVNVLRASAFFPDPHIASFFWGMTFPLAFFLTMRTSGRLAFLFGGATALILIADLLTFSRGGYVALIGAFLVFVFLSFGSILRRYIPALAVSVFLLSALIIFPNPLLTRFSSIFDPFDHSTSGRIAIWNEAATLIAEHPGTGVGLGNYSNAVLPSAEYREPRYAHNIFLDIAAETGIANSIIIFFLLATPITRALASPNPLQLATGFSLLVFSFHSLFETPIYSVHILPVFLALIALIIANPQIEPLQKAAYRE